MIDLRHGDCRAVLASLPESSVDAVISDPPYEIGMMGRAWDRSGVAFDPETWRAALRVAKPGAMLFAFGGTRTFHRLTCSIEDAGWEIRDCMSWLYGQGFPKSHNGPWGGTALKPAWEPIIVARKPLDGTVAANFEAHGTGGLNIDDCRIFTDWSERSDAWKASGHSAKPDAEKIAAPPGTGINCHPAGRWPANVLLTHADGCELVGTKRVKGNGSHVRHNTDTASVAKHGDQPHEAHGHGDNDGTEEVADWKCHPSCPVRMLDGQSGPGWGQTRTTDVHGKPSTSVARGKMRGTVTRQYSEPGRGGASRFFYCGKATRRERGDGNDHPTVKPLELMRWLVRLITPSGGVVVDPFMGSGTTMLAAQLEGFSGIGIDLDEHNVAIARSRLIADSPLFANLERTA